MRAYYVLGAEPQQRRVRLSEVTEAGFRLLLLQQARFFPKMVVRRLLWNLANVRLISQRQ